MVSVFTYPDVNTWEVGRTRDKRRKSRREAEWFPAYRFFPEWLLRVCVDNHSNSQIAINNGN